MTAADKQEAGRRRSLYRLAVARSDIRAAQEIAAYAEKHVPEINELWIPLQDALVAAYARPFTSNKPYGPLANQWTKFSDPKQQQLHNQLLQLRNELVAHTDASQRTVVIFPPGLAWGVPSPQPQSRATLAITYKRPSPDYFTSVGRLCDNLLARAARGGRGGPSAAFRRDRPNSPLRPTHGRGSILRTWSA